MGEKRSGGGERSKTRNVAKANNITMERLAGDWTDMDGYARISPAVVLFIVRAGQKRHFADLNIDVFNKREINARLCRNIVIRWEIEFVQKYKNKTENYVL